MKYLDALLRYFSENDFTHKEDVAIIISDIFEENPEVSLEDFKKKIRKVKRDFFRINGLDRDHFAGLIYLLLNRVKREHPDKLNKFMTAKKFISQYFEIGLDTSRHIEERNKILENLSTEKNPHDAALKGFNQLLDKIHVSYKIDLHGVKEYSGSDISKRFEDTILGFQIKTKSDDISEHMIRSESSKAQDWEMNGFVLVYARKRDKKVESSIQAAYHHFRILNDAGRMYCAIVYPELFAELLRKNSIST